MRDDVSNPDIPVDQPEPLTLREVENEWDLSIYPNGRDSAPELPAAWADEIATRALTAWWNAPRITDGKGIDLEP